MKTLEQLKTENAETETKANVQATQAPEAEAKTEEAAEVETEEPDQAGESGQEDTGEAEVESWMQADDKTPADSETVPLSALTKMRGKLKDKIHERDGELEQLRSEIEALKSGSRQQPQQQRTVARPTREQFDFDDDKYDAAMDAWYDAKMDSKLASAGSSTAQKEAAMNAQKAVDSAVDAHYQRAAKLATESGITPEVYQNSDLAVRQTIESVMPKMGDSITDALISRLGIGSEKVLYFIGRNQAAQEKLRASLVSDPSGISAALYLGELKSTVATPKKRVSQAPRPGSDINGDVNGTGGDKKAKEAKALYLKAHKSGSPQAAYNAKKSAKANGIDVSNW